MTFDFKCPLCRRRKKYNQKYDAYFCKHCDEWLEMLCGDRKCDICANRPDKPSEVVK